MTKGAEWLAAPFRTLDSVAGSTGPGASWLSGAGNDGEDERHSQQTDEGPRDRRHCGPPPCGLCVLPHRCSFLPFSGRCAP